MPKKLPVKRSFIIGLIVIILIQFLLIKYLYPFPNFMVDSYFYVAMANNHEDAGIWPVGYSKFIQLIGIFTHSDTVLVFVQYLLYNCGALYFYLTLLQMVQLSKWTKRIIYIVLFLNPAILYLSNYILSDIYFITISLIWISQLIRLVNNPDWKLALLHVLTILLVFSVRYQAFIYPVISIFTILILLRNRPYVYRFTIITGIVLLIACYIQYTAFQMEKILRKKTFSVFAGWQLANNALFAYGPMPVLPDTDVPARYKPLHKYVNKYFDSIRYVYGNMPDFSLASFYIWNEAVSPLKKYAADNNMNHEASIPSYKYKSLEMAKVSSLYKEYGIYLIRKYPGAYFNYYIWPNSLLYVYPPAEGLSIYNRNLDSIDPVVKNWFGYKADKVKSISNGKEMKFFEYYSIVFFITILIFIASIIIFIASENYKKVGDKFRNMLFIFSLYLSVNFIFSVLASPIVLRYQIFGMIIRVTLMAILVEINFGEDKKSTFEYQSRYTIP